MYRRPYLDSSVFIAIVQQESLSIPGSPYVRWELVKHILEDGEQGRYPIFTSAFTLAEVIRDRGQPPLAAQLDQFLPQYLERSHITIIDVDRNIGIKARELARAHGLKPADAIHLACAIRAGADYLLRWDDNFHAIEVDGVRVCDPFWEGQPELPEIT